MTLGEYICDLITKGYRIRIENDMDFRMRIRLDKRDYGAESYINMPEAYEDRIILNELKHMVADIRSLEKAE